MDNKNIIILEILDKAKKQIENESNLDINNGVKFENYVVKTIEEIAKEYKDISVEQTGAQSFPDIIIGDTYGIEVKFTKNEKWNSIGNSIFEGTLRKEVSDQIYIFFGSKTDVKIKIKYRKYEDCLADIKVTHSPRFYLDMNIDDDQSILHKIDYSYGDFKVLSSIEKSRIIKNYVRATLGEGESLWWLDEEESLSPKIREYNKLTDHQKKFIVIESMILFPEIFSKSTFKYLRLSIYLLQEYQVVSSSLRDIFTAGGREILIINGNQFKVPHMYGELYKLSFLIKDRIDKMEVEVLKKYWSIHKEMKDLTESNKINIWLELIDLLSENVRGSEIKPSKIFRESLEQ